MRANFSQTEKPRNVEFSNQVPERKNIQVQTEFLENTEDILAEYDPNTLSVFLKKATPLVCSVLERNLKSKAFERSKLCDTDSTSISRLYLLEKTLQPEFCCSSISWNSVGTAIAAAFSCTAHKSWCEHSSSVDLWSLNRKDFDPRKPNLTLETDCCITCVSFHPKLPAVIVAGKMNGEILLWDISRDDDPLLASTETAAFNHREPISGLHWLLQLGRQDKIEFASCSLDGKIVVWTYEDNKLKICKLFVISTKQIPRNYFTKTSKENAEIGITAMSINAEDGSIFVIGVEGGGIFQCSFDSVVPVTYSTAGSFTDLKNPITMGFERHNGLVTSVQFSPFSRNILLSGGSDGEIRIYTLLQPKPVMIFQLTTGGVNAAQWSTICPLVFSCVCNHGQLHVWDLRVDEKSPIESNLLTIDKSYGLALQNNKENPSLLATSSSDGTVQVWELSGAILSSKNSDRSYLQALSKTVL